MNNNKTKAKSNARTRIAIALGASLIALWQLPDPSTQETTVSKPMERMIPKQEELNVLAQPNPSTTKPIHRLTL